MAVRILIADDDVAIRRLLRRLLESLPDWIVCGDACNGDEVIQKAAELNPDIVVLDLAMPHRNGLQAAREISRFLPDVPMLLLTVQQVSAELIREAMRAGFRGAVSKDNGKEVVRAIESLLSRQRFFEPVVSDAYGRLA
jgi:DNA-binding NarL/FixJ family response regulator